VITGSVCNNCGAAWCPAAVRCASCGSFDLAAKELRADGVVRAFTWVHSNARQPSPWGLAQVETDDGVLLFGLTDGPLGIGDRATVGRIDDDLPVFVSGAGS